MVLRFWWHSRKFRRNLRKHGVGFQEAISVFNDPHAHVDYDELHSMDEERYILLGMSGGGRLLTVVFTARSARIHLISARKATSYERTRYEGGSITSQG
ncbi:MAG: BrnT family toxin [Gemmatimonadaceae bacterium]